MRSEFLALVLKQSLVMFHMLEHAIIYSAERVIATTRLAIKCTKWRVIGLILNESLLRWSNESYLVLMGLAEGPMGQDSTIIAEPWDRFETILQRAWAKHAPFRWQITPKWRLVILFSIFLLEWLHIGPNGLTLLSPALHYIDRRVPLILEPLNLQDWLCLAPVAVPVGWALFHLPSSFHVILAHDVLQVVPFVHSCQLFIFC